ncbi:hypothetical protein QCA50_014726 [Cerrena zonata]|uniref:Cytochrome P450 n=1 Tax=Cerrena zonata TaxID=2478898 RepID=A0AAW0FL24_9APHY
MNITRRLFLTRLAPKSLPSIPSCAFSYSNPADVGPEAIHRGVCKSSNSFVLKLCSSTVFVFRWLFPPKSSLPNIPSLTPTTPVLSFLGSIRNLLNNRDLILEGYQKYKGQAFKIPELFRWHVIVTGPKLIEELRKAPDEKLSFDAAVIEQMSMDWTFGSEVMRNPWHIPLIRSNLTRNLGVLFPDIREELIMAFNDSIPPTDEWTAVPLIQALRTIVSRTSNRIFVGAPVCRNPDWVQLNIDFTVQVATAAIILNVIPKFLHPIAGRFLTVVKKSVDRGVRHLEPVIKERYRMMEQLGPEYEGKPNDFLSWLMDVADEGKKGDVRELVLRVLATNFGAIHTSSNSFTNALFRLAANPEWIGPMREEVERVVQEEGWNKNALQKMLKLDSFLKESQRFDGLGSLSMTRLTLQDFTFSDGTFVPKGELISAAMHPMHHDSDVYTDPDIFNPWRFADLRSNEGEELKHQLVSTNSEYITFGHGRHACPGRFFAANELKGMLAHVVTTYDLKLEKEGIVPEPTWIANALLPNQGNVLFRKRRV